LSLARVKVWNPGDVLTANDLNAEFNNILNNPGTLISPISANLDFGNFQAVRMRLENVTTTQSPAQVGRAMFNSSADTIDIDDGSFIRHIPGLKSSQMTSTGAIGANDGALAKAWVVFNGVAASSQLTAQAAFNVSTSANALVRNTAGDYTIPWLFPFASTAYGLSGIVAGSTANAYIQSAGVTTSAARIQVVGTAGLIDATYISLSAFGVQV
jgi:hypothetical protein